MTKSAQRMVTTTAPSERISNVAQIKQMLLKSERKRMQKEKQLEKQKTYSKASNCRAPGRENIARVAAPGTVNFSDIPLKLPLHILEYSCAVLLHHWNCVAAPKP